MPKAERRTILSIVRIVVKLKTIVTSNKPARLFFAAGYISIGINGSHGPKINIVKRTHGVILAFLCP